MINIQEAQYITLAMMQNGARVDSPDADEKENLMLCAAAAEEAVLNYCHTCWEEVMDTYGAVPAVIAKAMRSIAVGMYEMPSGVDGRQQYVAPFGVLASLEAYKRLSDRT